MGDIQKAAETRIKNMNHDKEFTRKEQKSKLLLRNEVFLREWKKASKGESLHEGLSAEEKWSDFIKRWSIDGWWDGREETLVTHINIRPEVYFSDPIGRKSWAFRMCPNGFEWPFSLPLDLFSEDAFIYIKVSPWTLKEDFVRLWPAIRRAKARVFGPEERAKRNFDRDLYFFDLYKKGGKRGRLSYEQIRLKWNKDATNREQIKGRETIRFGINRIRSLIDSLTPVRSSSSSQRSRPAETAARVAKIKTV
jgi:hypothetical protein